MFVFLLVVGPFNRVIQVFTHDATAFVFDMYMYTGPAVVCVALFA